MKLLLTLLTTLFVFNAQAISVGDIIKGIGVVIGDKGRPHHPPHRPPPHHPGHGHGPGFPHRPPPHHGGGMPYPSYPDQGSVVCSASDRGWEEHFGGHGSCRECLRHHGDCVETCSSQNYDCRVDGYDRHGRLVSFFGRSSDQWRAQDEAMYNCRYNYAVNCAVVTCNQQQDVVSRRSCR